MMELFLVSPHMLLNVYLPFFLGGLVPADYVLFCPGAK